MSRTNGVHRGSGPSSKVSATVRAGIPLLRGTSPDASISGPPSRTAAGTAPARSARCVPSGAKRAFAYASTSRTFTSTKTATAAPSSRNASEPRRCRAARRLNTVVEGSVWCRSLR